MAHGFLLNLNPPPSQNNRQRMRPVCHTRHSLQAHVKHHSTKQLENKSKATSGCTTDSTSRRHFQWSLHGDFATRQIPKSFTFQLASNAFVLPTSSTQSATGSARQSSSGKRDWIGFPKKQRADVGHHQNRNHSCEVRFFLELNWNFFHNFENDPQSRPCPEPSWNTAAIFNTYRRSR